MTNIIIIYNLILPMDRKDSYDSDTRTPSWKVTQTNMIYIVGLPPSIASEGLLKSDPYCGQYGQITKMTIKKSFNNKAECYSAYVTYQSQESASLAVMALKGFYLDGSKISASYGTTKYCSSFLRYGKCRKFDCLYYHKIQPEKEIYQEDNWKVFNQQQNLARNYIFNNFAFIDFGCCYQNNIFPSRFSVRQCLIEEGYMQPFSTMAEKRISDTSTQYSFEHHQKQQDAEEIILFRKIKKAASRKKSLFTFAEGDQTCQFQNVNKYLQDFLQDVSI